MNEKLEGIEALVDKKMSIHRIKPEFRAKIYDSKGQLIAECMASPDCIAHAFNVVFDATKIVAFGTEYAKGDRNPSYAKKYWMSYTNFINILK